MVQLLTMKPRRCQLVSWCGRVLRWKQKIHIWFWAKGGAGEVWSGQRAGRLLSYSTDKNDPFCRSTLTWNIFLCAR